MEDDIDFKEAMKGVRRLKSDTNLPQNRNRMSSHSGLKQEIQARAQRYSNFGEEPDALLTQTNHGTRNEPGASTLFYLRLGVQKKILRDLKKGRRYPVERVLDLHGLTKLKARQGIAEEIRNCPGLHISCLLIIHGKGLRSENTAVLKQFTADYLMRLAPVKAYCSAQAHDGGTGALYVLVKH